MDIPEGWKLVPIVADQKMLAAACKAAISTDTLLDDTRFACEIAGWNAAIAVAPLPPVNIGTVIPINRLRDVIKSPAQPVPDVSIGMVSVRKTDLEALLNLVAGPL
jgi:hypothetical protein